MIKDGQNALKRMRKRLLEVSAAENEITREELALKKMGNGKAIGKDVIPKELKRVGKERLQNKVDPETF